MFTPTSKLFLPVAGVALFLGAVYKIMHRRPPRLGAVPDGRRRWRSCSGVMLSTVRENEYAPVVAADAPPPAVRAVAVAPLPGGGGWTVVGGVSFGLVMLGLIEHPLFTWAGVLLAMAAGAGWLARAASESTGRSDQPAAPRPAGAGPGHHRQRHVLHVPRSCWPCPRRRRG